MKILEKSNTRFAFKRIFISFFIYLSITSVYAEVTYTLSVVPQFSAAKIESKWQPLIEKIEAQTGIRLKIEHYGSIPAFEEALAQGTPDFAYMNPYHAYRAYELQGYEPIIRDKVKLLFGQLWVHRDSDIHDLQDLEGKELSFPAPNAFGASLYMRALIKNQFGVNIIPKYVKTHSNVYRHVAMRRSAAGGGVKRTYNAEAENLKGTLRELYETPGVRPHPICAHKRVPEDVRKAVQQAILELGAGPENAEMFKNLSMPKPAAANYNEDYAPLADLKLSSFAQGAMR